MRMLLIGAVLLCLTAAVYAFPFSVGETSGTPCSDGKNLCLSWRTYDWGSDSHNSVAAQAQQGADTYYDQAYDYECDFAEHYTYYCTEDCYYGGSINPSSSTPDQDCSTGKSLHQTWSSIWAAYETCIEIRDDEWDYAEAEDGLEDSREYEMDLHIVICSATTECGSGYTDACDYCESCGNNPWTHAWSKCVHF